MLALLLTLLSIQVDTAAIIGHWPVYEVIDFTWGNKTDVNWGKRANEALVILAHFAGFDEDSDEYYGLLEAPCYIHEGFNCEPPWLPEWWCSRAIYVIAWQKIEVLRQHYRRRRPFWRLEGSKSYLAYLLWSIRIDW